MILLELQVPDDAPKRLDRFLAEAHPDLSRSRWESWIREGKVRLNGETVTKAGQVLRAGDFIQTECPPRPRPGWHLLPESMDLPTLWEDDALWIIDKPAGLVVHPGPGHDSGTVLHALLARTGRGPLEHYPAGEELQEEESGLPWPGLVHRLDRYTTGCLALAKTAQAQQQLLSQWQAHTVSKEYLAWVRNSRNLPTAGSLLVDAPIARHRTERQRMAIRPEGRPSQTRVKVLGREAGLALIHCQLLTGRTHQIRVHLAHLGAPILGDALYGGPKRWVLPGASNLEVPHPMLHAWRLALDHPDTGERMQLEASIPDLFRHVCRQTGLECL